MAEHNDAIIAATGAERCTLGSRTSKTLQEEPS